MFVFNNNVSDNAASGDRAFFQSNQYLSLEQTQATLKFNFNIIDGATLQPMAPAFVISSNVLASSAGFFEAEDNATTDKEIIKYKVESGETLSVIAAKFGITLDTLLWANGLNSQAKLQIGDELTILPVSGLIHVVRERDTVSTIAQLYKAKQAEIMEFNEISEDGAIYAGDVLIIPNGKKPKVQPKYTQVPLSQSYFICPIPSPCRVTQGLHINNAIDFSNGVCGQPIYAAAGGSVQSTGYTSRGGNFVKITHSNGVVTYYGHLASMVVSKGNKVYQGQIIGYMGHTGHTIPAGVAGCHLHFDVSFAANPFAKYTTGDTVAK